MLWICRHCGVFIVRECAEPPHLHVDGRTRRRCERRSLGSSVEA